MAPSNKDPPPDRAPQQKDGAPSALGSASPSPAAALLFCPQLLPLILRRLPPGDQRSLRALCKASLRASDQQLTTLAIKCGAGSAQHNKRGELLGEKFLCARRMLLRGCRPQEVTLELPGDFTISEEAAVTTLLRSFAVGAPAAGSSAASPMPTTHLRLSASLLTPRVARAITGAFPYLTDLCLTGPSPSVCAAAAEGLALLLGRGRRGSGGGGGGGGGSFRDGGVDDDDDADDVARFRRCSCFGSQRGFNFGSHRQGFSFGIHRSGSGGWTNISTAASSRTASRIDSTRSNNSDTAIHTLPCSSSYNSSTGAAAVAAGLLPCIERVEFRGMRGGAASPHLLPALGVCLQRAPHLRSLTLDLTSLGPTEVHLLAALTQLHTLRLESCCHQRRLLPALLRPLTRLACLGLGRATGTLHAGLFTGLRGLQELTVGSMSVVGLGELTALTRLEAMTLLPPPPPLPPALDPSRGSSATTDSGGGGAAGGGGGGALQEGVVHAGGAAEASTSAAAAAAAPSMEPLTLPLDSWPLPPRLVALVLRGDVQAPEVLAGLRPPLCFADVAMLPPKLPEGSITLLLRPGRHAVPSSGALLPAAEEVLCGALRFLKLCVQHPLRLLTIQYAATPLPAGEAPDDGDAAAAAAADDAGGGGGGNGGGADGAAGGGDGGGGDGGGDVQGPQREALLRPVGGAAEAGWGKRNHARWLTALGGLQELTELYLAGVTLTHADIKTLVTELPDSLEELTFELPCSYPLLAIPLLGSLPNLFRLRLDTTDWFTDATAAAAGAAAAEEDGGGGGEAAAEEGRGRAVAALYSLYTYGSYHGSLELLFAAWDDQQQVDLYLVVVGLVKELAASEGFEPEVNVVAVDLDL